MIFPGSPTGLIPANSKNFHQQMQFMAASNAAAMAHRRQAGLSLGNMPLKGTHFLGQPRPILVTNSHPLQMQHIGQVPLMNSPSGGNLVHVSFFLLSTEQIYNCHVFSHSIQTTPIE